MRSKTPSIARPGTLLALALFVAFQAFARPAAYSVDIILKDQYGNKDGPGLHRGRILLLFYGRTAGLRRMKRWEQHLLERTEDEEIQVLRGLDARSARGKKTEKEANERLQNNVPPEISILIDWDGDLARAYAIPDADVSVTVIDAEGKSCGTRVGPVNDEALEEVLETIARLKDRGGCP